MSNLTAYVNSDNVLTLTGLYDNINAAYENAATVYVTLTDSNGTQVTGETWPLLMNYVSASNGNYRATLTDSLSVVSGKTYTATVTADAGTGAYYERKVDIDYTDGR